MKLLLLSAVLSCTAAFQTPAPAVHFKRAEQCAEVYDSCNVEELESLADELEQFQAFGGDHESERVTAILRSQSQLKRLMDGYAVPFTPVNKREPETDIYHDYLHHHW